MFSPVMDMLADRAKDVSSLLQSDINTYMNVLQFFAKHTGLAEVILQIEQCSRFGCKQIIRNTFCVFSSKQCLTAEVKLSVRYIGRSFCLVIEGKSFFRWS